MKEYGKFLVTWLLSMVSSFVVVAFWAGDYRATITSKLDSLVQFDREMDLNYKRIEQEGTRALQSHIVDNSRELKDLDRRVSHTEIIVESLSELKADVREIKVRLGDVQERQKRMEDLKGIK